LQGDDINMLQCQLSEDTCKYDLKLVICHIYFQDAISLQAGDEELHTHIVQGSPRHAGTGVTTTAGNR
jgi:hypothetical protein